MKTYGLPTSICIVSLCTTVIGIGVSYIMFCTRLFCIHFTVMPKYKNPFKINAPRLTELAQQTTKTAM